MLHKQGKVVLSIWPAKMTDSWPLQSPETLCENRGYPDPDYTHTVAEIVNSMAIVT